MEKLKVVVFVPIDHAEKVREVIGKAGGGKIGNYSYCSFSVKGIGRFKPEEGSNPYIGRIGEIELVEEERIEFSCYKKDLRKIIKEIKKVHPYEEVVIDVYPLFEI